MDDIEKQWRAFYEKAKKTIGQFPVLAAQEGVNFFQDSFRWQAWLGDTIQNWPKRKSNYRKDKTRALLVKKAVLKRSIRKFKADWDAVIVGTNVPYASVNNNGFRGTVSVKRHVRKIKSRNTSENSAGKNFNNRNYRKKVQTSTGIAIVKEHTMKMNIPKRQFIGNSPYLDKRIQRVFTTKLKSI